MAINRDYLGRTFPATAPYEVSRAKIAEFADAIGDPDPLYRDAAAAASAGHRDVVAPPTFPILITMRGSGEIIADPELGVDYAMMVHSEQRFSYSRPLYAGDVVTSTSTISDIRAIGRNETLGTRTDVTTVDGEHVVTAYSTLVVRGGAK